jgi:hypothetical protein
MTVLPQFRRGVYDRADYLVVSGAPAKIAGKPITNFSLARIRILFQKRPRRNEKPWRADAALERGMLEEFTLQRV